MGADTPVRSVRKAQEELAKIADAEPVPLLLQALTDFKERIIPLFELADTLKRCKTDLAACHSRVSTLESRISALEADRSRASTDRSRASQLRNEADERRREATELRQQTAALRHEAVELRAKADELRANVHRQTRLAESAVDTAARAGAEVVELRRANRSLLQEVARAQEEVTRAQEAEKAAVGEREAAVAEGARDRAEVVRFQGIVQGHQMKAEAGKRKRKGLVEEVRRLERENKRLQEVLGQKEMEMDDSLRVISESQEQSQELALEREQELALHTSDFATSPPRPAPSSSSLTRTHTILRSSPPPSCNDPEPDWTPGATFGTDWNLPPRVGVDKNNNNSKKRKLEISARPKLDLRAGPKPKLDIRAGPKPKLDLRAGPENNLYKARGFPIRLDARGRERGVVQLGPGGRRGLGRGG
ncbi:hypothetical protein PLICRDRAFT_91691 [Plicaturopsis crispa FD-325 SS-3]|nr:hypothetical protein PLICRDRAFT_91691 [Plicaturopsis crispa FD-325 SS-3]